MMELDKMEKSFLNVVVGQSAENGYKRTKIFKINPLKAGLPKSQFHRYILKLKYKGYIEYHWETEEFKLSSAFRIKLNTGE